ncbi:KamA family radical SAM protein [Desulfobacter latus]|uniref:L-lysine 2,3-aminomutase n=1 Tax=Desulfobacter latus TaxID=2292 RepID=A0A850SU10_9BACT|nr:KamA family radical SAM protein [Desulfobacter latus]NWH04844.1 KamA family radical SAM protein [Desulfobacter latus]
MNNNKRKKNNPKTIVDRVEDGSHLWKKIISQAVRDPAELCRRLEISDENVDLNPDFPMLVPEPFLQRIKPADPLDPLLLQVLPRKAESTVRPGFTSDPVGENEKLSPEGTLSKYHGRSLIVTGKACSIHCRFCFRRHLPLPETEKNSISGSFCIDPETIAAQFEADPTIHEVILSGGDPLMLSDRQLQDLIFRLDQVSNIQRIRIHSRMPIIIPQRLTGNLLGFLGNNKRYGTAAKIIMVLHINHPNEIDTRVCQSIEELIDSGCILLSQTVLLRQVNDALPVLCELFERLINLGVMPYYLHQLDRVAGATHFDVSPEKGCDLITKLRTRLPGYAIPRYVREISGEPGKVVLK